MELFLEYARNFGVPQVSVLVQTKYFIFNKQFFFLFQEFLFDPYEDLIQLKDIPKVTRCLALMAKMVVFLLFLSHPIGSYFILHIDDKQSMISGYIATVGICLVLSLISCCCCCRPTWRSLKASQLRSLMRRRKAEAVQATLYDVMELCGVV